MSAPTRMLSTQPTDGSIGAPQPTRCTSGTASRSVFIQRAYDSSDVIGCLPHALDGAAEQEIDLQRAKAPGA